MSLNSQWGRSEVHLVLWVFKKSQSREGMKEKRSVATICPRLMTVFFPSTSLWGQNVLQFGNIKYYCTIILNEKSQLHLHLDISKSSVIIIWKRSFLTSTIKVFLLIWVFRDAEFLHRVEWNPQASAFPRKRKSSAQRRRLSFSAPGAEESAIRPGTM